MDNIMETMFLKRFCLPSNTDLDHFKSNNMVANKCICGNYFHVSCVFQGKYNRKAIANFHKKNENKPMYLKSYAEVKFMT